MKTTNLFLGICLSALIFSRSDDSGTSTASTADEAKINVQLDEITDDISAIAEEQYDLTQASSGRITMAESALPDCATVTFTTSGSTWTKTIDFGTTGCEMPNGNILKGVIIISGSNDFDAASHTISYTFDEFYHNDKLIEGNRTIVRSIQATDLLASPHPVANMDIAMTVTFPDGGVYTRNGSRVREMVEGFNTPDAWIDNIFWITGNWTTTFPNGNVHVATITDPLRRRMNCPRIVRGIVEIMRNDQLAVLNYGNGECDNLATVTLNGETFTITLGN